MTAQDAYQKLRGELLKSSLSDDVPLAEVESVITGEDLAQSPGEIQQLGMSVIRSLVEDGLMKFVGWESVNLDDAMDRVRSLFVDQYDDPGAWAFAVWLTATDSGKQVAEGLKAAAD
jgi:hypothetical protein